MKEIELIDLEFKDGVLGFRLNSKGNITELDTISLVLYNTSLRTYNDFAVRNLSKEGRHVAFSFSINELKVMKELKNGTGTIEFFIKINGKLFKIITRSKLLKDKVSYGTSIFNMGSIKSGLLFIENKLAMAYGDRQEFSLNREKIVISYVSFNSQNKTLTFSLPDLIADKLSIVIVERKAKMEWIKEINTGESLSNNTVILDLTNFIERNYNQSSRWDFFIEYHSFGVLERSRIGLYDKAIFPKRERYFDYASTPGVNVLAPFLTDNNGLSLVMNKPDSVKVEKLNIRLKVVRFKMKRQNLSGSVVLSMQNLRGAKIKGLVLKYRSNTDPIEYFFPVSEIVSVGPIRVVNFKIDISKVKLENYYWDFYFQMEYEEDDYLLRLRNPLSFVKRTINKESFKQSYQYQNGYWVYPYITAVNTLALIYKEKGEHESFLFKVKEKLAYAFYILLKWYFDKKSIWIAFEKFSDSAQDNGFYFFKYCYNQPDAQNVYYIIKESSADYENVVHMKDKLLHFMSFKYLIYLYAAKVLISSEAKGHAYDIRAQKGLMKKILKNKRQVFLQHGVLGLKKVDQIYRKTSKNAVDLFVVSSEYEKQLVKNNFGYEEDEIILTGLSRWDALIDKSSNNSSVLLMPTWRSWMDDLPEEKFIQSDYYKQYVSLLNSSLMSDLLEKYNMELNFFIHPKFKAYIEKFNTDNERIKIYQYGEEKVNQLLMKSCMLITDYSSVAWDMYYQHKPIIFYQFDLDDYMKYQGSYMNMDTDLFGDRAFTVNSLLALMKKYAESNFQEEEKYAKLRKKYLTYTDRNNSNRILKAILQKYKN